MSHRRTLRASRRIATGDRATARVPLEIDGSRAALAWLRSHPWVEESTIVVMGHSFSGAFLLGTVALRFVPPAVLFFALEKEFISGLTSCDTDTCENPTRRASSPSW